MALGRQPSGMSWRLPKAAMRHWLPRKTQIFAAEAVALLVSFFGCEHIRGKEVLCFVNNEAAVSSLMRVSAHPEDEGRFASAVHLQFLRLGTQAWFEWIDSACNPSDGLSRARLQDAWTIIQSWDLLEVSDIDWEALYAGVSDMFAELHSGGCALEQNQLDEASA